jgi:hypothetical protein
MACPAAVQDVIFHADEVACSVLRVYDGDESLCGQVISVGAEAFVSHWDRHTGKQNSRIKATAPSVFTARVNPSANKHVSAVAEIHRNSIRHLLRGSHPALSHRRFLQWPVARSSLAFSPTS